MTHPRNTRRPGFSLIELPKAARHGFTLIELLVVITIIVVLLAMLAPALDKAVYQAELAICGARVHSVAAGALIYATDYKRFYPYRRGIHSAKLGYFWLAEMLTNPDHYVAPGVWAPQASDPAHRQDDRPMLMPYIPLKAMTDPLSPAIDLSIEANPNDSYVMAGYAMRFGWKFAGEAAMSRIGSQWTYGGQGYSILASDRDDCVRGHNVMTTHPDRSGYLVPQLDPEGNNTDFALSRWQAPVYPLGPTIDRGELDMNFAYEDGSVRRFDAVGPADPLDPDDEEGFVPVPRYAHVPSGPGAADHEWVSTPRP